MASLSEIVGGIVVTAFGRLGGYLPQFLGGLVILLLGLLVAAVLYRLVIGFFKLVKIDKWMAEAKIARAREVTVWTQTFAELIRWATIILFLVPAVEAWGVPRVTEVLNKFLLYLPNVFVAVVVGLVGMVAANLSYDIVRHGAAGIGSTSANALGAFAKYAIVFFTALVVLNQLGVAAELIRILFTGIVAMLTIAGGLAFGLGGQEVAKDILNGLREKLEK